MTLLAVEAGSAGVTAALVDAAGSVRAWAHHPVDLVAPAPGQVEAVAEDVWQAALAAVREVLPAAAPGGPTAVGVTGERGALVLWDVETLGSPRPVLAAADRRTDPPSARPPALARLAWLAEHEPHTWALVEDGRYAVGTLESYLVARMTRGTWHLTDLAAAAGTALLDPASGAWDEERCGAAGVPVDALAEVVPSWGEAARTDPRSFLDLSLPVAGVAAEHVAGLVGHGCLSAGAAACTYEGGRAAVLVVAEGPAAAAPPGFSVVPGWQAPGGATTYLLAGEVGAGEVSGGVTGRVRDLLAGPAEPPAALHVGGPDASDAVCQAQADLLGVPVHRAEPPGPAVLGAGLLAGLGTGTWASLEELRTVARPRRSFLPR